MSLNMTEFAILQVTGRLCNRDVTKLASGAKISASVSKAWSQLRPKFCSRAQGFGVV